MRFKNFIKGMKPYIWIIAGSIITAAAINIFLVPFKLAPGGVTGIATVVYYLSSKRLPVGITMLALNIPLFILGMKFIGGRFIVRTLFSTVLLSVLIDLSEPFTGDFVRMFIVKTEITATNPDLMLYCVFGGFFMGLGLGLVFKSGATTGGTDLAARIVNHFFPHLTMGQLLLIIDSSVIIFATIAFNSFLLGLYAIVSLFISTKVIDAILEGVNFAKAVYIISNKPDEISKLILTELDRGVTSFKGVGMYTRNDKDVLYCVLDRAQIQALKQLVVRIDPDAFVILTDVREVLGEGW